LYEVSERQVILDDHLGIILQLLGESGTLIVPTTSSYLCNKDIPFDINKTHSESGLFAEHVRRLDGAVRSFHPFSSYTALGRNAMDISCDVSRHAYGPETPMDRMIEMDALFISIGIHPHYTCTAIHQVEMDIGVPYRYVREYNHPVARNEEIRYESFYRYIWYTECNIKKNYNIKVWDQFSEKHEVKAVEIGRGLMYSYSMCDFYKSAIKSLKEDIYALIEEIPLNKPYRQMM
jgi:aminoglycoside 3-N-acetyltransferase